MEPRVQNDKIVQHPTKRLRCRNLCVGHLAELLGRDGCQIRVGGGIHRLTVATSRGKVHSNPARPGIPVAAALGNRKTDAASAAPLAFVKEWASLQDALNDVVLTPNHV